MDAGAGQPGKPTPVGLGGELEDGCPLACGADHADGR